MRALLNFLVGWKIWTFIRNDIRRFIVVGVGLVLVGYLSNEIEKILVLKENDYALVILIITKNVAYLALATIFFVWPLFRRKNLDSKGGASKGLKVSEEALPVSDGYDFIRRRGRVRSKSEIFDELLIKDNKAPKGRTK
jgi:hypothetical protein